MTSGGWGAGRAKSGGEVEEIKEIREIKEVEEVKASPLKG
jgi:hypothetical protein